MSSIDEVLLGFGGGAALRGRTQANGLARREYSYPPISMAPFMTHPSVSATPVHSEPATLEVTNVRVSKEDVNRAGRPLKVHVAVKSAPINVSVRLLLPSSTTVYLDGGVPLASLSQLVFDVSLYYYADEEQDMKEVDYIKVKPVEWKVRTVTMHSATLDIKIKTLTSHHEDSLFCVSIECVDSRTGGRLTPALSVMTPPIKVISKQEPGTRRAPSKKKQTSDALVGLVSRIDAQVQANNLMLRQYIAAATQDTPSSSSSETPAEGTTSGPASDPWSTLEQQVVSGIPQRGISGGSAGGGQGQSEKESDGRTGDGRRERSQDTLHGSGSSSSLAGSTEAGGRNRSDAEVAEATQVPSRQRRQPLSFERAFSAFVQAYANVDAGERAGLIRRAAADNARDRDTLSSLVTVLEEEKRSGVAESTSLCACRVCPCQKELEQIDAFYRDITANQDGGPSSIS